MTDATPRSTFWSSLLLPIAAVLTAILIALPFFPVKTGNLAGWDIFTGRLHPLVVHFPIVLMVLPLVLWLVMGMGKKESIRGALPWIWTLAVLSSLVSVLAGYFLYHSGEYEGKLVENHFWGGIAVAVIAIWAAWTYARFRRTNLRLWLNLYVLLMILGNGAVIYTGHLGGSLTHGEDFITEALPMNPFLTIPEDLKEKPVASLRVFDDMLMPVFKTRCISCHNANKTKGGFVMASFSDLTKGGKSEKPALVAGNPDSSELYHRVILPADHDDRMPPEGKKGMASEEITLLRWWIARGANPTDTLGAGPEDPQEKMAVEKYLTQLTRQRQMFASKTAERRKLEPELRALGDKLGLIIQPDPDTDSLFFAVSMQIPPTRVTDETVAELQAYAPVFSRISLVSSEVTDEGLYALSGMTNLRRLLLQKTCIDGSGLISLQELDQLEVLGLSHTNIDDVGVLSLIDFPALRQVFLYNTKVGENLVQALDKHLPNLKVSQEEGPYF